MKKTTKKSPTFTGKPRTEPAPVSLPPVVAALAAYADGGVELSHRFLHAWAQMPALVTQAAHGGAESRKGTTRWQVIDAGIDAELMARRRAGNAYTTERAKAVEAIRETDPDLWTEVQVIVGDAAFNVGFALAAYLLTSQAPITMPSGGAR